MATHPPRHASRARRSASGGSPPGGEGPADGAEQGFGIRRLHGHPQGGGGEGGGPADHEVLEEPRRGGQPSATARDSTVSARSACAGDAAAAALTNRSSRRSSRETTAYSPTTSGSSAPQSAPSAGYSCASHSTTCGRTASGRWLSVGARTALASARSTAPHAVA